MKNTLSNDVETSNRYNNNLLLHDQYESLFAAMLYNFRVSILLGLWLVPYRSVWYTKFQKKKKKINQMIRWRNCPIIRSIGRYKGLYLGVSPCLPLNFQTNKYLLYHCVSDGIANLNFCSLMETRMKLLKLGASDATDNIMSAEESLVQTNL